MTGQWIDDGWGPDLDPADARAFWAALTCGARHHQHPDTRCTEPAGHYHPGHDPHAGPLIIDGRHCGGAAWDEPKEQP